VQASSFHVDIIDGYYADNITVSPADLQELDFGSLQLDIHLLVDDPTEWVEECIALSPNRLIAQVEKMGSIEHYIEVVRGYGGAQVGIGVGLYTPITSLSPAILKTVDVILLMAIEPGFGGTPFHPAVLPKITELRAKWSGTIITDGGINPETYKEVLQAGADEAGANSALWRGDFAANWHNFLQVKY
jgi:ribulose-phosphate 3-epimerase